MRASIADFARSRIGPLLSAFACLLLAVVAVATGLGAQEGRAALSKDNAHTGVASCGGTTCHGRQQPDGKIVRQDEILRWQEPSTPGGAHSRAAAVLAEPRARAIAARLGLGLATTAPDCLGCHSDPGARGAIQLRDGVGCEACHGGAQNWLASHRAVGGTHAANVARGMVPLDRPAIKANVCLDCHFGSPDGGQFVSHRMMAAGHPRLSFELDLFSTLQQHNDEDGDYAARKGRTNHVRVWAVGQAIALDRALSLFASPALGQEGAFPEFYFFDCHSCHRRIEDGERFQPAALANPGRPVAPGSVPFNDENMIMLTAAARVAAPALAGRFDANSKAFHRAMTEGRSQALAAAARLRSAAEPLATTFGTASFGRTQTLAIIDTIGSEAIASRFTDYAGSAQSVMAIDTLLNALVNAGQVPVGSAQAIRGDINRAYAAVREPNGYRPLDFRRSLGSAVRAIRALR